MDYLDPNKKRAHKIRLLVGYVLFAIMIALSTVLLVFISKGYFVDSGSGEVIQNGLVFVDSRPAGATVYLNGERQRGTTDIRMVIPGDKSYSFDIKKDGYRDWSRTLRIEGGSLRKLTYAKLIPNELVTENALNLRENPIGSSQSIDKRWLVLNYASSPLQLSIIDTEATPISQQILQIPTTLVANPNSGVLEVIEWADDDRYFLASYSAADQIDYLLIDRENPQNAVNINTVLGNKNLEIGLRDRVRDQFFVYDRVTKLLYTASLNNGIAADPFISRPLLEYTTFGTDWVAYVVESGQEGLVEARFKRGDSDIQIQNLKTDSKYLIELAKLGNAPIMGFSSPVEGRAMVYFDPQKYLKENEGSKFPVATTALQVPGIQELIISADSTVILGYGPENMASHEFEPDRSYNFIIDVELDDKQEPRWVDGQHLSFSSGGVQYMIDFDGSNLYKLVSSMPTIGSYYSNSINTMFTFSESKFDESSNTNLPATLQTTSLLTEADR